MPESYQKIGLDAIKSVDEHICRILRLLNTVVKSYKLRWNIKNKGLEEVEEIEGKFLRGSIIPCMYEFSGKFYIEWYYSSPVLVTGTSQSLVRKIKKSKGLGYFPEHFESKAQPWELELILKTEEKLRLLRYSYECLYTAKKLILRTVNI